VTGPDEWLVELEKRLDARRPRVALYESYYAGEHRLSFVSSRWRETFGRLFSAFADNWCALVVDASVERLGVEGFRFGDVPDADVDAWAIWQANDMDAQSMLAHTEAVKCGESYALVAPGADGEPPTITVEHPSQCIVAVSPGMRRQRLAALKKWVDDDGYQYANVYLPDVVAHYRAEAKKTGGGTDKADWSPYADGRDHPALEVHDLAAVPMVAFSNEPGMMTGGTSDLAPVIQPQDAVNKLIADMLVASEFAAFPQRWATGIDIDPDDEDAVAKRRAWMSSAANVWTVGDPASQFGQFAAADLGNYTKAIEMIIQHIAALTRTPPHYLLGQSGAFPSGESLKATETGLVAKVRRKQLTFGDAWEQVMRLAMTLGGTPPADGAQAETLWRDPESRTTGEQTDAAVKELALGIPEEEVWRRRLGMSPQEIARIKAVKAATEPEPEPEPTPPPTPPTESAETPPGSPQTPPLPPPATVTP
jgi:hypothetical protein